MWDLRRLYSPPISRNFWIIKSQTCTGNIWSLPGRPLCWLDKWKEYSCNSDKKQIKTGSSKCSFMDLIMRTSPGLTFFSGGSLKIGPLTDEDVPLTSSSCFPRLVSSGVVGSHSSFFLLALFLNASSGERWTRGRSDGERSVVESGLWTVVNGGGRERRGLNANKNARKQPATWRTLKWQVWSCPKPSQQTPAQPQQTKLTSLLRRFSEEISSAADLQPSEVPEDKEEFQARHENFVCVEI